MAIGARRPYSRVRAGKNREPGMVEGCALPIRRRVTQRASRREMRGDVIGIVGALVIGLVARVAIGRGMNVIVVDVTTGARNFDVGPGQGELRLVVVKGRGLPCSGVVADFARRGESGLLVRRIVRALVILHVATGARGAQASEISVQMAALALQLGMCPGEGKSSARVIENRIRPRCCVVADRAIGRKSCLRVIRIGRFLIILQVARSAILGNIRVVVVDVAAGARRVDVRTG